MIPTALLAEPVAAAHPLARRHPATKIAGLTLALATWLAVPAVWLPGLGVALFGFLWWSGVPLRALSRAGRPWLFVAVLVLAVHTLSTVEAAPLGRPSWAGLREGVIALARVAGSAASLALFLRIAPLTDLISGSGWWLRAGRRFGLNTSRLSLVVAVALGTIPTVLVTGRRIEATVRLRRGGSKSLGRGPRRWWRRIVEKGHLLSPLIENLFRRADGLTLSLQNRLPGPPERLGRPPWQEWLALGAWVLILVLALVS